MECRNPSTAFFQAFQSGSRLKDSKMTCDRYSNGTAPGVKANDGWSVLHGPGMAWGLNGAFCSGAQRKRNTVLIRKLQYWCFKNIAFSLTQLISGVLGCKAFIQQSATVSTHFFSSICSWRILYLRVTLYFTVCVLTYLPKKYWVV